MNSQTKGDEFNYVGVNDHMRFYKYEKGQYILCHDDYRMSRFRHSLKDDKWYLQMTFFTLLIYLNEDFTGGNTVFWSKHATKENTIHCRFIRDKISSDPDIVVSPEVGKVLINDHVVQHAGLEVTKGTKYVLRTDIVHEKEVSKERVTDKFKKRQEYGNWHKHFEPSCKNYTE